MSKKLSNKFKEEFSKTTLYVKNIPQKVNNEALEQFFSEIGPIKYCFQVISKENAPQKAKTSYGFVQYVMQEDASRAIKELTKINFHGSKLILDYSKHRQRSDTTVATSGKESLIPVQKAKEQKKKQIEFIKEAKVVSRTVIVDGLKPDAIDKKALYKKAKKFGNVQEVIYPAQITSHSVSSQEGVSNTGLIEISTRAQVVYVSVAEAKKAVKHLHNHTFKGKNVKAYLCPNLYDAKKDARLMIKNIPFTLEGSFEQVIYDHFSQHGCVMEISVPCEDGRKKNKGYAFVTLGSASQAEEAVKAHSQSPIQAFGKRRIGLSLVIPKDQYLAQKAQGIEKPVLNKRTAMAAINKDAEDEGASDDELVVTDNGEDATDAEDVETASINESIDIVTDAGQGSENEDAKSETPFVSGSSLFVRNISFESSDQDLFDKFSEYGPVQYARIVTDRISGKSRGTAFIQFYEQQSAQKALEVACQVSPSLLEASKGVIKVMPEMQGGIHLNGRILNVLPAVKKQDAETIAQDAFNLMYNPDDKDKRNIYLLKEGYISPNSSSAKDIPDTQVQVRHQSFIQRKAKLQKHMHLYLSKTRLSIRNLGKKPDEKWLKQTIMTQVRQWKSELVAQLQDGSLGKSETEELKRLKLSDGFDKSINIKQLKIIRDDKNIANVPNLEQAVKKGNKVLGESLGYGFVEFTHHAHALGCLRRLNNNPDLLDHGRRLIVEFAIENSIVVKKLEERRLKSIEQNPNHKKRLDDKENKEDNKTRTFSGQVGTENGTSDNKVARKAVKSREKPQNNTVVNKNKPQHVIESKDVERVKTKSPKKRKASDLQDDFDVLVNKYKKTLVEPAGDNTQSTKRWFDAE